MRIALAAVVLLVLCLVGYGVAFQQPSDRLPPGNDSPARAKVHRDPYDGRFSNPSIAVVPGPEGYSPAPVYRPGAVPPALPQAAAGLQQQLAVVISKSGLRFLSPRSGIDIEEIELAADSLLVICDSADVTTDAEGKPEVVCRAAGVIRAAGMSGRSSELRYKAGRLVLEGDESDSLIARNKGDKTVFMLRAKTIHVDLNTNQIEASDGSVVQLKPEAKPVLEASLPSEPSTSK